MNKLERIIIFEPAYDKRDPNPSKNYGVHGVNIRMVLKGKKGAVQFLLYTSWMLPEIRKEFPQKEPMPVDFGYHSPKPMYEDQGITSESCEYLDGQPCYYDGSSLYSETVFDRLCREGDTAVWEELEIYYNEKFGGNE